MATTRIHPITSTPHLALRYCMSDKIEEITPDMKINENVSHVVFENNGKSYVKYYTLVGYYNCNVNSPYSSFEEKQKQWQNTKYTNNGTRAKDGKEPLMYHLHQSFDGQEVSPSVANEIGLRLAQEVFKGFTVVVSTHSNTENVHNHFNISAWNDEGKKWNKCNTTYNQIRKVSDRLCKEYGLKVLENTREMRLTKYYDNNEKIHYYEKTERKDEIIRKRQNGEIFPDEIGSYRNTDSFKKSEGKKESNRTEIKNDIDVLLPTCNSYEELLCRLHEMGYTIRDKKKNGEWLALVSFKAPQHLKATREDKLGDGVFYTRENLSKYLLEKALQRTKENEVNSDEAVEYFDNYEYGKTDLSKINENYKKIAVGDKYEISPRSNFERKVIKDIKEKDFKIIQIDTSALNNKIRMLERKQNSQSYKEMEKRKIISEIKANFRCLQYSERNNVASYEQIISFYSNYKSKYLSALENTKKAEKAIERLKAVLLLPQKIEQLRTKIESNKPDIAYMLEQYEIDKKILESYEKEAQQAKINTASGYSTLLSKVEEFEQRQAANKEYLEKLKYHLSELDNCMRTYDRIDTESGAKNIEAVRAFSEIYIQTEKNTREEKINEHKH